jgi:hypothetical protein
MDIAEVITEAKDAMQVRRVFGDPFTGHGTTLIPAASIRGGGGGGQSESPEGRGEGLAAASACWHALPVPTSSTTASWHGGRPSTSRPERRGGTVTQPDLGECVRHHSLLLVVALCSAGFTRVR